MADNKKITMTESLRKRLLDDSKVHGNGNRETNAPSFRDKGTHLFWIYNLFPLFYFQLFYLPRPHLSFRKSARPLPASLPASAAPAPFA